MTTLSDFVDQASTMLHSYTGVLEATTYLTAPVTDTDTVINIQHPSYITRGLVEIEDELVHVESVGDTSATLYPFGRGVQGSAPAAHSANVRVTNDPYFPRAQILAAMRRCLHNIQFDLFAVKETEFNYVTVQTSYELPVDTIRVLSVQWQVVGPSREWVNVSHWDLDSNADTATGKALILRECIQAGRPIQVVYAAELPVPTDMATDLETVGIPEWMQSVILYGTCWEVIQFLEPARLQLRSVEARTQGAVVESGAAGNIAKQLYAMYQLRLDSARKRLLQLTPSPKHYTRY